MVHIVGAGINGLLCAYMFARDGWSVIVSDAGPIPNPTAASHGLHRLIHPWSETSQGGVAAMTTTALHMWQDILDDIGCSGFSKTGVLVLTKDRPMLDDTEVWHLDANDVTHAYPQFRTEPQYGAVIFPSFGVLWASTILTALTEYLSASSVEFRPQSPVISVSPELGQATFKHGLVLETDLVAIAAGRGLSAILRGSPDLAYSLASLKIEIVRSFVLYGTIDLLGDDDPPAPAWASLGAGDLWGMPALRGHPAKLGCGDLSEAVSAVNVPWDRDSKKAQLISHYSERFPVIAQVRQTQIACNHWVRNNSSVSIRHVERCSVILSDNGSGFKNAPCVARELVEATNADHPRFSTSIQQLRAQSYAWKKQSPSAEASN